MFKRMLVAGLLCTAALTVIAQADTVVKTSGQVRFRAETSGKDFDDKSKNNNFNLLRSRVGAKFVSSDGVTVFVLLQDSRVMGEETSTLADGSADRLDFREAFMKVNGLFWDSLDLKLGRMHVNYGEQRLLGAVGWDNVGRSFDGGILTRRHGSYSVDAFAFAQVDSLQRGDRGDLNVLGFNTTFVHAENHTNQLYFIWQRATPSNRLDRYTVGYYVNGKVGNLEYKSNAAYQGGQLTAASVVQDVKAYMLTLDLWYRMNEVSGQPRFSIGVAYLSGDDNSEDSDYKVFDTLYATNHKFYGFMDYFLNIPRDTGLRGLVDTYARALVHLGKVPTQLDVHVFRSAEDFSLSTDATSKDFGLEIDLTVKHKYSDTLTFVLGASVFDPGAIFKDTVGTDSSNWAYLMVTASM